MDLSLLSGSANIGLANSVARKLGLGLCDRLLTRFPDTELHVELRGNVRGKDVYLLQPTNPPVDEHLLELALLADACFRSGAARLTGVIPYLGYARQDRRTHGREPLSTRVIADLLGAARLQRVVAVNLHSPAIEGAFSLPLEHLSAVPILAEAVRSSVASKTVIVAPDLGAAKLADHYGELLHLPVAIIHKARLSGEEVVVRPVFGEVKGKSVLIVDDMISTGGTVETAIKALLDAECAPDFVVVATHGLFVGSAAERFRSLPVRRLLFADSVPAPTGFLVPFEVVSLAPLLAETIQCLHNDRPPGDLAG